MSKFKEEGTAYVKCREVKISVVCQRTVKILLLLRRCRKQV